MCYLAPSRHKETIVKALCWCHPTSCLPSIDHPSLHVIPMHFLFILYATKSGVTKCSPCSSPFQPRRGACKGVMRLALLSLLFLVNNSATYPLPAFSHHIPAACISSLRRPPQPHPSGTCRLLFLHTSRIMFSIAYLMSAFPTYCVLFLLALLSLLLLVILLLHSISNICSLASRPPQLPSSASSF